MNRGVFLSELRKNRGLSQNDIASFLGYSPQLISLWEKDKASPDLAIIGKYANKLDIDLDGFINCVDKKENDYCSEKLFNIESFSNFIKRLRKESGLLQSELANKVGVNVKSISSWENKSSTPSIEQFISLSKLFNLTYDELYFCYKNTNKKVVVKSSSSKKRFVIPLIVVVGILAIGGVATGITFFVRNNKVNPPIEVKDNFRVNMLTNKVTYGYYPQSKVKDIYTINVLNTITEPSVDNKYKFENDYYVKQDDNWYKCDEISWWILSHVDNEYTIISDKSLDVAPFYNSLNERTIEEETVYPTNYLYSDIRTWLNDTFFNSAFFLHNEHIKPVVVDNSPTSTDSLSNPYTCPNSEEKVFMLSYQEYSVIEESIRRGRNTEYSIAKGAYNDSGYGYHWTRSPSSDNAVVPWCVDQYGNLYTNYGGDVTVTNCGVRPCIVVKE